MAGDNEPTPAAAPPSDAAPHAHGAVEIRLKTTGAVWRGDVQAQGAEHVRIRVHSADAGVLPSWNEGTMVDCSMESDDGRFFVEGEVIRQEGPDVWLRVPPIWSRSERRTCARVAGGFPVSYRHAQGDGIGACVDVSAGGIRLRLGRPLPLNARIELCFKLPGESLPVRAPGAVLYVSEAGEATSSFDHGIKFIDLPPLDGARIARYSRAVTDGGA